MLTHEVDMIDHPGANTNILITCRAELLLLGGAPKLAYEDTQEVLKDDPEDFFALCVKAKCMFMMADYEKSLMTWHKARKIRPNVKEVS